jgi:hypothetical protein
VSGERALRFTRTAEKELRRLDPPAVRVFRERWIVSAPMIARSMSGGSRAASTSGCGLATGE